MTFRSPEFERALAEAATSKAGLSSLADSFHAAVQARLAKGAAEYGDTWPERGIERLLAEMLEEGADGGGWGTLAARLAQLGPDVDERVGEEIMQAVAGGVLLWYHGHRALELVRDGA